MLDNESFLEARSRVFLPLMEVTRGIKSSQAQLNQAAVHVGIIQKMSVRVVGNTWLTCSTSTHARIFLEIVCSARLVHRRASNDVRVQEGQVERRKVRIFVRDEDKPTSECKRSC